jgi:hypothetical protein
VLQRGLTAEEILIIGIAYGLGYGAGMEDQDDSELKN